MINLRVPGDKEDSMQVQMGNVRREMESLRKNQNKTSEIKNTGTEILNDFDRFINRLNSQAKSQ